MQRPRLSFETVMASGARSRFSIFSNKAKDAIQDIFGFRNIPYHAISTICEPRPKKAFACHQCTEKEAFPYSSLKIKAQEWKQKVRNPRDATAPPRDATAPRKRDLQQRINLQRVALLANVFSWISADELLITIPTNAWMKHAEAPHHGERKIRK